MKPLEEMLAALPNEQYVTVSDRFTKIGRDPLKSPAIIVLIGPPACGKSTWTGAHVGSTDRQTVILSSDNQVDEYAKANGLSYAQAIAKIDMQAFEKVMEGALRVAVAERKDIIVDRTNMRLRPRRRWLGQAPRHYVRVGVHFEVELAVLYDRLERRARETGKYIPRSVVEGMIESFQPPSYDEFDIIERVVARELV